MVRLISLAVAFFVFATLAPAFADTPPPPAGADPATAAEYVLQYIYVPLHIKAKLAFVFVPTNYLIPDDFTSGVAVYLYQSNVGMHILKIATQTIRKSDGTWDFKLLGDIIAHEVGHAVWYHSLNDTQRSEFRKVTPELHERSLENISEEDCRSRNLNGSDCFFYFWQTHRHEYFAESYRVLFCTICSFKLRTDSRWPVTLEVTAYFKKHFGGVWREPRPEETVP